MEAFGEDKVEVETSEEDTKAMNYVHNAFDISPVMVSGLPSMMDNFKRIIETRLADDKFGRSLEEISKDRSAYRMDEMLGTMLLASMKGPISQQGSKKPVFKEEVDMFLRVDGASNRRLLSACMSGS